MFCLIVSIRCLLFSPFFFFFNDPATTEIYTLSLHDALPIFGVSDGLAFGAIRFGLGKSNTVEHIRSEEHTSELQSHSDLVCRLLLEKKKKKKNKHKAHRQAHCKQRVHAQLLGKSETRAYTMT